MSSDSSHQPAVKVRLFRVLGRRFSTGQHDHRLHQEAARNDGDSTDSDQSSEERGSPGSRGRRSRCKKGGSAESNSGESSSSGGGFSCSQRGVGSSSDSGSSNGDNSPSSMRVSSSGAAGWGSDGYLSGILIPVKLQGTSEIESGKLSPIRKHNLSALRKVFQGLSLSSNSLASLSHSRSSGGNSGVSEDGGGKGEALSSSGGEGIAIRDDHRVPRRHHHHHHTHHQHHSTDAERERGSSASWSSGTLAESDCSTGCGNNKDGGKRTKKPPRKILRSPVSHAYLRGISGLPTQRVPRHRLQVAGNPSMAVMPAYINGYDR